jgi:hypothetical protein
MRAGRGDLEDFLGKEFSKKFSKQALARKNLGFF